jgi:hypothetical protein
MGCRTYGVRSLYLVHPDVESRVSNRLPSLRFYSDIPQSFLEYVGYYVKDQDLFSSILINSGFISILSSSPYNLHNSSNVVK